MLNRSNVVDIGRRNFQVGFPDLTVVTSEPFHSFTFFEVLGEAVEMDVRSGLY